MSTYTPTSTTQPEALRLANEFRLCNEYDSIPSMNDIAKAEAELSRQHARIAELEADHFEDKLDMVARWYMVDKDGMATLCTDMDDAEQEAKYANIAWPHLAPHRAVQLVEVGTSEAELHPPPPEGMAGWWIALPGTLPDPGTPVLLDIGKKYPIRAMWAAKHTLEVGMDDDSGFGEYDETTDTYYCPEGWYEWNEHEETHWAVDKTPRAWAPLPPTTATDSGKGVVMADTYKVKVIKADTGEVVKTLEAVTERAAERIERGLNINMNHADYYTVIEPPKDPS